MDLSTLSYEEWEEAHQREVQRVKRMSELALGDLPKPPALIHGLLLDKTLTMLSSEPYTGKTLLTLAMALSLDSLRPLFGTHQVRERKRILYLGQDAPNWDYAEQSRKLIVGYDLTTAEIQALDMDLILNTGLDLLDARSLKAIQDWHAVSNFNVLFLDTLQAFHSGDENSSRDMGVVCAILKSFRDQFRCAVIFTHHTAKPSQGVIRSTNYSARGSSVIAGSIDFHLHLRREPDRIKVTTPKGRGSGGMKKSFTFQIIEDTTPGGAERVQLVTPDESGLEWVIHTALTTGDLLTRQQLISITKSSSESVDNALLVLSRAGKIKKIGRATWRLA